MYARKWTPTSNTVLVTGADEIDTVYGDDKVVLVNGHCWGGKDAVLVCDFLKGIAKSSWNKDVFNEEKQPSGGIPSEVVAAVLALVARDLAKFPRRPESAPWYDRVERDARNLPY